MRRSSPSTEPARRCDASSSRPAPAATRRWCSAPQGPIRRLELRAYPPRRRTVAPTLIAAASTIGPIATLLEVDEVAYVGLRDYLDVLDRSRGVRRRHARGPGGFDGRGKLAFLPNHEYELKLTTRVSVAHPSTPAATADVEEFVYFRTKGLPGLNAVARIGDELQPYVRGAYAGGRAGWIYREEPVTLAFSEGFHVAVPLAVRPPGTAEEHTTLLRMQLLVTPEIALSAGTAFTVTADDWIATHHGAGTPPPPSRGDHSWFPVKSLARSAAERDDERRPVEAPARGDDPARGCVVRARRSARGDRDGARRAAAGRRAEPAADPPGSSELWPGGLALHGERARRGRGLRRPAAVRRGRRDGALRRLRRAASRPGPWPTVTLQVERQPARASRCSASRTGII